MRCPPGGKPPPKNVFLQANYRTVVRGLAPNPSAAMGDADRLPMANVSRIVQNALPKDSAIAKEARVALSACATVFVHYVTELAVQQCDKRKKLTLTPDDILEALREAEFDGAASVFQPSRCERVRPLLNAPLTPPLHQNSMRRCAKLSKSFGAEEAPPRRGGEATRNRNLTTARTTARTHRQRRRTRRS